MTVLYHTISISDFFSNIQHFYIYTHKYVDVENDPSQEICNSSSKGHWSQQCFCWFKWLS